jgi:xanthine/uracil permease
VGIGILSRVDFENTGNLLIIAVTIGVGLLPVVAPKIYQSFPVWAQVIGGSAITSAALTAFVLNLLFNHTGRRASASQ